MNIRKKAIFTSLGLLLGATGLLAGCQAASSSTGVSTQQAGIWVTGEGKVSVVPDIASVQLGIEAQAGTVREAQAQATAAMNSIMAVLRSNGIQEKDIQTRFFNIQRVTRWDPDKQQEITLGYRVTNTVNARVRDLARTGAVIDAAVQAGGDLTRVDSVSFTVEDPIRYHDQARAKAVANAADRAKQLALQAGVKLGKPVFISESSTSVPPTPIFARIEAGADLATPISPGELDVTLTVQVVYSIR